jgi:hypothetical protein
LRRFEAELQGFREKVKQKVTQRTFAEEYADALGRARSKWYGPREMGAIALSREVRCLKRRGAQNFHRMAPRPEVNQAATHPGMPCCERTCGPTVR